MDDEIIIEAEAPGESKIPDFKRVCARLGVMMVIVFVTRGAASLLLTLISPAMQSMDEIASYLIRTLVSILFLNAVPIISAYLLLKTPRSMAETYAKPKYFSSAMGLLPACMGLGYAVNILTLAVGKLFEGTEIYDSFNTTAGIMAPNVYCALILAFQTAVLAPILEEFWFRGIILEALKPYGNGFAILVSAFLFGLTHANFQQFFYAFVLGIVLGYAAVSTRSVVTTTVMHAVFNSFAAVILVFLSAEEVQQYILSLEYGFYVPDTPVLIAFKLFVVAELMFIIIGVFMAIFKLRRIKRYKVPKVWGELSAARRWGVFFSRAAVIVMLVLAADTFTFRFITKAVYRTVTGTW